MKIQEKRNLTSKIMSIGIGRDPMVQILLDEFLFVV